VAIEAPRAGGERERHGRHLSLALGFCRPAELDVQGRQLAGDVAPLVAARKPVPARKQQLERHAGVHRPAVEEVAAATGVGGLDQLGVRLIAEQRVKVLGAPVIPARVAGRVPGGAA
jgi:hypothetical protein